MADKLCVFCKHLELSIGSRGYGEYTPPDSASISCGLGIWETPNWGTPDDFRKEIIRARTCNRYECAGDNAQ